MAKFTTTIELHNADENNYEILHAELVRESFVVIRQYPAKKGSVPVTAKRSEYQREGNITIQEVTDAVMRAALKTGKKYSFTIIRNKPFYN